jgi:hypothetical protein
MMTKWILPLVCLALAACTPASKPADEVVSHLHDYLGEKVVVEVQLRSGARCRVGKYEGEFKTYCRDCQYCRGPLVVDVPGLDPDTAVDDWPLVLGGMHDGQPIKCEGKLGEVECHPFDLDKKYVIRGSIERTHPPKLLVSEFWEADE